MNKDLLLITQDQVTDLIKNGFFKEAKEICIQAEKVFNSKCITQLKTIAIIGLKNWHEAEDIIQELLNNNPSASDYNNLSIVKKSLNQLEDAKKYAEIAYKLNFQNPNYLANLSNICFLLGEVEEAHLYIDKAIALNNSADLWQNKASYFTNYNKYKDAIDCYKKAIKIEDKSEYYVEIFYILAKQRRFPEAWQFYEHRYMSMPQLQEVTKKIKLPILPKDADKNAKIAIFYEQGLGDNIMFLRFVSQFQEKFPNSYVLDNDESLRNLINYMSLQHKPEIIADTEYMVGIMSLPFHLSFEKVVNSKEIYFHKPRKNKKLNIGLVWAGSAYHPSDNIRSAYLSDFESILQDPEMQVFSFMKDKRKRKRFGSDEIIDYAEGFENYNIIDYGNELNSVSKTLELLDDIDVLISVDTAIVHIAGLKNVPTFLLINDPSDWRWGDDNISSWYPKTKIFRKNIKEKFSDLAKKVHEKIRGEYIAPPNI